MANGIKNITPKINNGNGDVTRNGSGNGISNRNGVLHGNENRFNHDTQMPNPLKSRHFWINATFYLFLTLLVVSILLYAVFAFRSYFQKQKITEIENKIAVYGTEQQKASEKQVLDYKKKIDDFVAIIDNHKISLSVFNFIESKTLPNVWFSNFDMSKSANEIRLNGESESMETLSRQVQVFEESKDYIKSISVLTSQTNFAKNISFTLNLILDPTLFNYDAAAVLAPASQ